MIYLNRNSPTTAMELKGKRVHYAYIRFIPFFFFFGYCWIHQFLKWEEFGVSIVSILTE